MITDDSGSELERRQEQYHALKTYMKYEAVMPVEHLGQVFGEPRGLPSHIKGAFECVPEGLTLTAVCTCGGRHEALVDIRKTQPVFGYDDALEEGAEAAHQALHTLWLPEHFNCASFPIQHHTPKPVQQFLDVLERSARKSIAEGSCTPLAIYVLDTQRRVSCVPPGYDITMAQFMARQEIRAQGLDVVAVAVVASGWSGKQSAAPDTANVDAMLEIVYSTPSFARAGQAPITPKSKKRYFAGKVGAMKWTNVDDGCWAIDSLLA